MANNVRNFREAIAGVFQEQIQIEAKAIGLSKWNQIKVVDNGRALTIDMPQGYEYVITGRKKGSGIGSRVPIQALVKWIKKKNIRPRNGQSLNQLAWAIQTSIYLHGIKNAVKGRDFIESAMNDVASKFSSLVTFSLEGISTSKRSYRF